MNIKGLVFDLDGVITETAQLHYLAWKKEVAKIGIDFTETENSTLKGIPRVETLIGILKIHNRENDFSMEEIEKMANSKNESYQNILKEELNERYILPGIKQLLDDAKKMNLKLSIASSSLNATLILEKIKLIDYFDYIVDSSKIKNGKPAPDIFIKACEGINIDPSEAIGFEDAMPGIIGLKKAKLKKIVAITHGEPGDWNQAHIIVEKTEMLKLNNIL